MLIRSASISSMRHRLRPREGSRRQPQEIRRNAILARPG